MNQEALARQLFQEHDRRICEHTDRLFAGLMTVQWLASIAAAYWISPLTWAGTTSTVHLHVWSAIYLGGLITLLPVGLALARPGRTSTRMVIATSQVLMSTLLIHYTGGRIETHFHVFASLVFLSFYRDWRVLVPATAIVAGDHFIRGVYWPESVFGVVTASHWRWLEHAAWVLFEDVFLVVSCVRSKREMWSIAERTAALHESEERYRAIVERADGIFLAEAGSKRLLECNAAFLALLGYDPAEMDAITLYDIDMAPTADVDRMVRRFAERRTPMDLKRRYRHKNGSVIDVRVSLSALAGGRDTLCGAVRDVTDHLRAEQALEESQARNAAIVGAALDCIITFDAEGTIVEFNPAAEQTFQCPRERAIGQDLVTLTAPPALRERYAADLARYIETGEAPGARRDEGFARRADGSEFPAEYALARILTDTSPLFACFMRDLTEQKQAEEALRQSEANLRQANKMDAVGQLAGGIAHDFNNLLTAIIGYAEVVANGVRNDRTLHGHMEQITRAGQAASSLTRQLLAFSRRQILQPTVLDLNSVLANVDKMLRRLIGEHIDLVGCFAPDLRRVRADAGQLEQVIVNLAVNARDAMRDGGKLTLATFNLRLAASNPFGLPAGEAIELRVTDTGCGMDPATQAKIFEPFFTTKEPGKGTGLGLSTVYGIVTQSGGAVAVESAVGRGTTFRIILPSVADADVPADAPPPVAVAPQARAHETVLVVEDEPGVRDLACLALEQAGYTVLAAAGPEEAIRIATAAGRRIDLILTDVVMPFMSGPALVEWLAVRFPGARVLFMSGYTDEAIVPHGVPLEGINFLHKPFTPSVLCQRAREVLDAAAAEAAA